MPQKEIEKLVENSGNNFHYKVVNFLRENGWEVMVSPYYNDSYTDKPREIDIVAEKESVFKHWSTDNKSDCVCVRLFIECKYIKDDTAFWFDKKDTHGPLERVLSSTPLEDPKAWSYYTERHRYLSNKEELVAKLFTSGTTGKQSENDVIFKALTQSINAMVYFKDKPSILEVKKPGRYQDHAILNYPVVVCSSFDSFYKIDVTQQKKPELIKENFLLEVNYAYVDQKKSNQNEYFLIDFVNLGTLPDLIIKIESSDLSTVHDFISKDY